MTKRALTYLSVRRDHLVLLSLTAATVAAVAAQGPTRSFRARTLSRFPRFDGVLRPCPSDGARVDAYLAPPPCPPEAPLCRASSNHCAGLEVLPGGALALSWFTGYREGWEYTGAALATLSPPGAAWSAAPIVLPGSRVAGFSTQNPVLFYDARNDTLWVFPTRQPSKQKAALKDDPVPSQETMGELWAMSAPNASKASKQEAALKDDPVPSQETMGELWAMSAPNVSKAAAAAGGAANHLVWSTLSLFVAAHGTWGRNSVLNRLDGSWLFPVYNESQKMLGHNYEHSLLLVKDAAAPVLPFDAGSGGTSSSWENIEMRDSAFLVQPSIVRVSPGNPDLRVFYRDRRAEFIYTATSPDDGATWTSPVPTTLPNNNAGIHALVLDSGAMIVVYNDMKGETKGDLRNVLAVGLSDDGGASWTVKRMLESHPDTEIVGSMEDGSSAPVGGLGPTTCNCYSYPTAVQTPDDGFIHIAFTYQRRTIKYTRVTERWIRNESGVLCQ